ncbi:monooxygenase [Colletotrichum gloeosporioides Cg-14]|uniref:Monooxygenase n=1 Tax=Colletotrichum gloeosporioides (strain Cg-14) TaxID=1237896 RepID=T0M5N6_COLGC|nr:monooxygenase [Colletotrichum gloeosporioides Cg-14]
MHLTPLLAALLAATTSVSAAVLPRAEPCTTPAVRKEWRELAPAEKADYLRAAVCLRSLPHQKYAAYEAVIHEDLLRNECNYTGVQPYWDWTIDADARAVPSSPLFDAETGFGGNGQFTGSDVPGFQRCVVDGPFANTNLTLSMGWPDVGEPGNRLHCLTREFNSGDGADENGVTIIGDMQAGAFDSNVMNTIYAFEGFGDMVTMLEGLPHAQVHSIIYGDMGPATSPNEPLFFLHHANVDRVWAKWQGRNDTRLADYTGFQDTDKIYPAAITDSMPVLELADTDLLVRDYMDTLSGPLCYTYSSM